MLTIRHRIVIASNPFPVTRLLLMVRWRHQKFERHLERLDDLPGIERECEIRFDPRDRRQNAKAGERKVEIEIADRFDQGGRESDLLPGLAHRSGYRALVAGIDLAAGESNLPGVTIELGSAQGQQHGWRG